MAERRMFAKSIVLSDAFLDMPLGSRCLYMTMSMVADDDGFVNTPKSIMRQCGATEDDMKVLIAKKFIIPFESGVVVIKHWRINNYLRSDRYHETNYTEEKKILRIKENKAYTLAENAHGIPNTVDRDKDSIDKYSIDNNTSISAQPNVQEFEQVWERYPRKRGKDRAFKAYIKARKEGIPKEDIEQGLLNYIAYIKENQVGEQYIQHGSTWFTQRRWTDDYSMRSEDKRNDLAEAYKELERELYE